MKLRPALLVLILLLGIAPNALGQWVQTNGPYGGNITALAGSGTNIYAGTQSGIFRSTDNGKSWTARRNGIPRDDNVISIVISGTNIFAGTFPNGVFRSSDSGKTWRSANNGLEGYDSHRMALAINGKDIFALIDLVYRSTNNGASWSLMPDSLFNNISVLEASGSNLFAGKYGGDVLLSTDSGTNWTRVDSEITGSNAANINAFAVSGTKLFAGTDAGIYAGGGFLSTDSGKNWTSAGLANEPVVALAFSGSYLFAATFDSGVFVSSDEGTNWENIGFARNQVNTFLVDSTNLFAGTNDGVFFSTDTGKSWFICDSQLIGYDYASLAVNGSNFFASTGSLYGINVFRTTNTGISWNPASSGVTSTGVNALGVSGTNLYAGTYGSGIFLSTDNADNWAPVDSGLTRDGDDRFEWSFGINSMGLFVGTSNGVFLSTDSGANWIEENNGIPLTDGVVVDGFASLGTNLFAAANSGYNGGNVFRSVDNGTSWNDASNGLPSTQYGNTPVRSLAVIGTNLFAAVCGNGGDGGVFLSTDSGASWTVINTGLTDTNVDNLLVSGTGLFAGTFDGGVFLTTNNGKNWQNVDSGLTDNFVHGLAICGNDLIVGTDTAGVWRRPLSEMIPVSAVAEQPAISTQIQSYPNPFNQSATISVSVAESGVAQVTIVNLLGEEVARLFSGELDAGEHDFSWDASGFTPGMYECIAQINGQVQRVPMMLIRN